MKRLLPAVLVVLSSMVLVPGADAEAPDVTGWWGAHRATTPDPGLPVPVQQFQTPATVPPGGLFVAGEHVTTDEDDIPDPNGAQDPNAPPVGDPDPQYTGISAVRVVVGEDADVGDLVLRFHKENGVDRVEGTVAIQACPAVIVWTPEEGGPIASAPQWDCSLGLAFGTVEESTVRLPLGALLRDGVLDIVLRAQPGSAFQAVFAKPGPDSISVTRYPREEQEEEREPFTAGPVFEDFPALPPTAPVSDVFTDVFISTAPCSCTAPPVPPASGPSRRIVDRNQPISSHSVSELSTWQKAMAGGMLAVLVALYLVLLRLPSGAPLPIGPWAAKRPAIGNPAVLPRGIGRFARPRTGPHPRL